MRLAIGSTWTFVKTAIACSRSRVVLVAFGMLMIVGGAARAQPPAAPEAPQQSNTRSQSLSFTSEASFSGSVPYGKATPTPLKLSLKDALESALTSNLGVIASAHDVRSTQGGRLRALADLLPNVSARITRSEQQVNLAAFGFPPQLGQQLGVPTVVGPFGLSDARVSLSAPILDLEAINNHRAAQLDVKAAQWSYRDAREMVVLVVANLYLLSVSGAARVEAAQAQLETAQALYQQAIDRKNAGTAAGIDVLRAQVELQSRKQLLLAAKNDFEKQRLDLARSVGLPTGQQFTLADAMPYAPAPVVNLDQALARAYQERRDVQRAQALISSAEAAKSAARAEAFPSLSFNGDYGAIGRSLDSSHGTFTATASLRIPVFQGGKVKGDLLTADALAEQRKAELENVRGQVDAEVRKAFLDLQSANEQIEVTREGLELAKQTLAQARDRYAAGVTDNIEVVQAQEALAAANESYITSVYTHNIAKASLARAVGVAEKSVREFLGASQ